jgi:hypothetical protein
MPAKPRGERPGAWWIDSRGRAWWRSYEGNPEQCSLTRDQDKLALWRLARLHKREIERLRRERDKQRRAEAEAAYWRERAERVEARAAGTRVCATCMHRERTMAECIECATCERHGNWEGRE